MTVGHDAVNALTNENQAVMLYCSGMTYQEVADAVGYADASGTHKAVQRALQKRARETAGARDELIERHREIIRICVRGQMPKVVKGDSRAMEVVVKALEREAKLLGLDAPVKADLKITDALTQEISELMDAMASLSEVEAANLLARERG